jgi:Lrp/AsnC family transcriptional regulator for asnA, asnC and gidA
MGEDALDIDDITNEISHILNEDTEDNTSKTESKTNSRTKDTTHSTSHSTAEQIIRVLQNDARKSKKEIADKVGVSEPTVRKYTEQLEKKGVITGYSIDIAPQNLETTIAMVKIGIETEGFDETSSTIADIDEVYSLFTIRDSSALLAEVRANGLMATGVVVNDKISSLHGVETTSMTILEELHN